MIVRARELRRETETLLASTLLAELAVVRTMCTLAKKESGAPRFGHIAQAEKAFRAVLALATRVKPSQKALDSIETARYQISSLREQDISNRPQ